VSGDRLRVDWTPRAIPLAPCAAFATGAAARALGRRLLALDDARLAALAAVAAADLLLVVGAGDDLPWIDGAGYLGRDPAAPELLLPTTLAPTVPAPVLARAVRARLQAASASPPAAVLAAPTTRIVPCGGARAIDRARLAAWLDGGGAAA